MIKNIKNVISVSLLVVSCNSIALSFEDSKHLFQRAGMGVLTPREYEAVKNKNRDEAIDWLLSKDTDLKNSYAGEIAWLDGTYVDYRFVEDDQKEHAKRYVQCIKSKSKSWLPYEMINNTNPILERMLIFWHGHFVTSLNEVSDVRFNSKEMLRHMLLYRGHALGNYKDFVREMTTSWFMLNYLDGAENIKDYNNNNFARELLELFTLGVDGGYTEKDIWELAVALTGYSIDISSDKSFFDWDLHDKRPVLFMGEIFESEYSNERNIKFEKILDKILSKKEAHNFIVRKIWDEFISTGYDKDLINEITTDFAKDFDLKRVVERVLKSDNFWDESNRKGMIKSPIETLMGAFRLVGLNNNNLSFKGGDEISIIETSRINSPLIKTLTLKERNFSTSGKDCVFRSVDEYSTIQDILEIMGDARIMSQDFYSPPSVSGWRGGESWINAQYIYHKSRLFYYLERFADRDKVESMDKEFIIKSLSSDPESYQSEGKDNLTIIKELLNDDYFLLK